MSYILINSDQLSYLAVEPDASREGVGCYLPRSDLQQLPRSWTPVVCKVYLQQMTTAPCAEGKCTVPDK